MLGVLDLRYVAVIMLRKDDGVGLVMAEKQEGTGSSVGGLAGQSICGGADGDPGTVCGTGSGGYLLIIYLLTNGFKIVYTSPEHGIVDKILLLTETLNGHSTTSMFFAFTWNKNADRELNQHFITIY